MAIETANKVGTCCIIVILHRRFVCCRPGGHRRQYRASSCPMVAFSGFYESPGPPSSGNARGIAPSHRHGYRLSWKCRRFRCCPQLVLTTWCRVFPTRRPDTADVSATSCDVGFFFSVSYVVSLPNCRHVVVVSLWRHLSCSPFCHVLFGAICHVLLFVMFSLAPNLSFSRAGTRAHVHLFCNYVWRSNPSADRTQKHGHIHRQQHSKNFSYPHF
jgi:hypothetical protein